MCLFADVAVVLGEMANIRIVEHKYSEAMALLEETILISRTSLGEAHPIVGIHLRDLALVLSAQARHTDAVAMFDKALSILVGALGNKHPDVASVLAGQAV